MSSKAVAMKESIEKLLYQNKILVEDIRITESDYDGQRICISISWGDWKHDHAYLRYLLTENGYDYDGYVVTEEDGGDCYSADHYVHV